MKQSSKQPSAVRESPLLGRELRISFACPGCRREGWILWEHLKSGLRCPACECRFQVGPDGKLHSQHGPLRVRYSCPRCSQIGAVSSSAMLQGAECIGCGLALLPGPDRQLYGQRELAVIQRQARDDACAEPLRLYATATSSTPERRSSARRYFVGGALFSVLGVGWLLLLAMTECPPEAIVRQFTEYCLDGRWDAAEDSLADNEFQRMEFQRWRIMHFASIIKAVRPTGDDVEVEVTLVQPGDQERTFEVRMTSTFFGVRRHAQKWSHDDTGWHFDAANSLKRDSAL